MLNGAHARIYSAWRRHKSHLEALEQADAFVSRFAVADAELDATLARVADAIGAP